MNTGRLEAFSDGVFAVAITLLVLNIGVPNAESIAAHGGLGRALLAQWPSYISYILSFITVGITWINHHQMFTYIKQADHGLLILNTLLLMSITFVPFPTALVAEYIQQPDQQQAAMLTYGAVFTVNALFFNAVWWYAASRKLLRDDLDPKLLRNMMIRYIPGPLLYLAATLFALISVPISLLLNAGMAIFYLIPNNAITLPKEAPTEPATD